MATIPITYQEAQSNLAACQAVEAQIRSSKACRKNDPFDTFKWSYETAIELSTNRVLACLVATSQGVNWDARIDDVPAACFNYWIARGKKGLI